MKKFLPFIVPIFRSLIFILIGLLFVYFFDKTYLEASRWWSVICIIVNIITIFLLLILYKGNFIKKQTISNLGLKYTLFIILLMIILGMGGMYLFGYLVYGYIPVTMIQPIPIWVAVINLILLPLTVVFAEFPLYFGYALNKIDKITGNKVLAISYPMFFYALQHSFIPLLFDWNHILFRFLSYLPLMFVLGVLYYKNRDLKSLMIGHSILDTLTGLQILLNSIYPEIFDIMNFSK